MKKIIVSIFLFTILVGFSQEINQSFSLDEAITYALENNRTSKNAALDIKAAEKRKWETTTMGLPQISAKIDYQNFLKQPVSLLPAAAFDNTQSTIDIVQNYFDGVTRNGNQVNPPQGFIPVRFGTKQNVNANATLSQLLFDGSYLVGLQSAKVYLEISKNAKEKTDLEIRKAVINAYGNVLLAQESVKITENNKIALQKSLNETQKIYENGLTEEENVEQLQITLSQLENNLQNAKRLEAIAHKMFSMTLGLDLESEIQLTDNLESLTLKNVDLELLNSNNDVTNNIDYKIAKNDKRSKELLLKLEKSKALPQLTAFVNGGYAGNSDSFTFLEKDQQWFGSSLFGVSLNIPIFSSLGRSASTQRAKINLEKANNQLKDTEQQLKFKIASAKSNYKFAVESYQIAKQNLSLAERIEKKNQTKFFEGISTSFDLRQAQTQLYAAQAEFLQAMLNVITQKTALETALNKINK